ncbi:MAG: phosphatase PAP2 family protein [Patescibacteria group bacterium]
MLLPDVRLFRSINNLAGQNAVLDAAGIFASKYLIYVMAAAILVPIVLARRRHRDHVAAAVAACRAYAAAALGGVGNMLFSMMFFRARPFVTLFDVHRLIDVMPTSKSFPSDHATAAFAMACSVFLMRPRFGAVLLVLAVFVAAGRVYAGVHYPTDVISGAVVGCLWAWLIRVLGPRFGEVERMERLLLGRK